jgi:hypothetical protein
MNNNYYRDMFYQAWRDTMRGYPSNYVGSHGDEAENNYVLMVNQSNESPRGYETRANDKNGKPQ